MDVIVKHFMSDLRDKRQYYFDDTNLTYSGVRGITHTFEIDHLTRTWSFTKDFSWSFKDSLDFYFWFMATMSKKAVVLFTNRITKILLVPNKKSE